MAPFQISPGKFVIFSFPAFQTLTASADPTYTPWMLHENALSLSGMNGPESVWAADPFAYPSATNRPSQLGAQTFDTSFSHHLFPSDSALTHRWQTSVDQYPSIFEEAALNGVGRNLDAHSFHPLTLSESPSFSALMPSAHSPDKHVSASRLPSRSTAARSLRHTPYPIGMDSTRRTQSTSFPSVYQCRWLNGAIPCGMMVTGTKKAIAKHLQDAHAIPIKDNRTEVVCQWDNCQRSMRRESMARHILAVHNQDKVPCPRCGSRFARTDSLQRHQRSQCLVNGKASSASKSQRFDLACRG